MQHTRVIGLSGKAGAGKTTLAARLSEFHKLRTDQFSKPLKEMVCVLLGVEELPPKDEMTYLGVTVGRLLQLIGDGMRRTVDPEIWVKALFHRAESATVEFDGLVFHSAPRALAALREALLDSEVRIGEATFPSMGAAAAAAARGEIPAGEMLAYGERCPEAEVREILGRYHPRASAVRIDGVGYFNKRSAFDELTRRRYVVVDDVRYRNEADAIKRAGGTLVRLKRSSPLTDGRDPSAISETELDDYEGFDYYVEPDYEVEKEVVEIIRCAYCAPKPL